MEQLLSLLPDEHIKQVIPEVWKRIEEIRIGAGRPMLLRTPAQEIWIEPCFTHSMIEQLVQRICKQSVYAYQTTIRQGFVTLDGGHRVGICGTGIYQGDTLTNITDLSSLAIRVARQVSGCADGLIEMIQDSALVIGPPCSGKTTLLRDFVRQLSDYRSQHVSLVDERGELAAMVQGVPQMAVGIRTDVLTNIPKGQAMMMLLRTMNPKWIAVDEITAAEDIRAMEQAAYCGVKLVATAHASNLSELMQRPLYLELMQRKIFKNLVVLHTDRSYTIQEVAI